MTQSKSRLRAVVKVCRAILQKKVSCVCDYECENVLDATKRMSWNQQVIFTAMSRQRCIELLCMSAMLLKKEEQKQDKERQ